MKIKRIIAVLLVFMIAFPAGAGAKSDDSVLFSEGFEQYATNAVLNDYSVRSKVIERAEKDKALQLRNGASAILKWNTEFADVFTVQLDVFYDEMPAAAEIFNFTDTAGKQFSLFKQTKAGESVISDMRAVNGLTGNRWNTAACTVDLLSRRYSIFINGKCIIANYILPITSGAKIKSLTSKFESFEEGGKIAVDNMRVYKGKEILKNFEKAEYNPGVLEEESYELTESDREYKKYYFENFDSYFCFNAIGLYTQIKDSEKNSFKLVSGENSNKYVNVSFAAQDPFLEFICPVNQSAFILSGDFSIGNTNTDGTKCSVFSIRNASQTASNSPIVISGNGIYLADGTTKIGTITVGSNFTNIACAVNLKAGTCSVYINGEKAAENIALANAEQENLGRWRIHLYGSRGELNFDNIFIYGGDTIHENDGETNTKQMFAADSVAKEQANGVLAMHSYANRALINGERVELAHKPIHKYNSAEYKIPSELLEKGFGILPAANGDKISLNGIQIPFETVDGEKYFEIKDAAEALGINYFVDNSGSEQGFAAMGNSDFESFKADEFNFREINNYLIYDRPKNNEILRAFEKTSKGAHPRIIFSSEEMQSMLNQAKTESVKMKFMEKLLHQADVYLNSETLTTTKTDGARLHGNYRLQERAPILSIAYLFTKNEKYKERLWYDLKTIGDIENWNPQHFLDTSRALSGFAIAYDWLYDKWSEEEKLYLEECMMNKGLEYGLIAETGNWENSVGGVKWCYTPTSEKNVLGNWQIVCQSGLILGATALMDKYPDICSKLIETGLRNIEYSMPEYDPNGAFVEGTNYWSFTTEHMTQLLATLDAAFGSDYGFGDYPSFSQTWKYALAMNGPGGAFNFGDATYDGEKLDTACMGYFSNNNNYKALMQSRTANTAAPSLYDMGFLNPREDPDAPELEKDMYFFGDDSGMIRSGWENIDETYLAYHVGANTAGHGHIDTGVFVFDSMGVRWASLLGMDNYQIKDYGQLGDYETSYRMRAEGNNTLVINPDLSNGQSKEKYNEYYNQYGQWLERRGSNSVQSYGILNMTAAYGRDSDSARRGFMLRNNRSTAVIRDEIHLKEAQNEVYWFMHCSKKINIRVEQSEPCKGTAYMTKDGKTMKFDFVSNQPMTLSVMEAERLSTSPEIDTTSDYALKYGMPHSNKDFQKIAIHGTGLSENLIITVQMSPESLADAVYEKSLDEWTTDETEIENSEKVKVNSICLNGAKISDGDAAAANIRYFVADAANSVVTAEADADVDVETAKSENMVTIRASRKENPYNFRYYTVKLIETGIEPPSGYLLLNPADISASAEPQANNPANHAMDGELETRWAAEGEQYLTYDLGASFELCAADLAVLHGEKRNQFFEIQTSSNGKDFTSVLKTQSSGKTNECERYSFSPVKARYIRLLCKGTSEGMWNSISEFYVYGK